MKSALVVLFNQDFSRNIPKLEAVYQGRFSEIVYIVPDHCSRLHRLYIAPGIPQWLPWQLDNACNKARRFLGRQNPTELKDADKQAYQSRIYRVVGHQFYFYHYLAQAAVRLLRMNVDWYWVTGDDAVLHPELNEHNLPDALSMNAATDAVLCRPVIGSDAWIRRISGSVSRAESRMRGALGERFPLRTTLDIQPEPGAMENTRVAVACADFFGVRRDVLEALAVTWRQCFREKIYVEMAMPNALLANSRAPLSFANFIWERGVGPGDWQQLADRLKASDAVFAHPLKLSSASCVDLHVLRGAI